MSGEADSRKRRSREERKAQMVAEARRLFLEQGFEQTSLSDIIERTGGSRRDIYDFFGDKEGLFEAVLKTLMSEVLARSELSVRPERKADLEDELCALGETFLAGVLDPAVLATIRQFVIIAARRPDLGHMAYEAGPAQFYKRLETYLQGRIDRGDLDLEDAGRAARILAEMVKAEFQVRALMTGEFDVSNDEIRAHVRAAVRLFLRGAAP